jgi:hypothetical protein
MRVTTFVLAASALSLATACGPRTPKPVPAKPTAPELDVDDNWTDPTTALPLRSKGDAKMRQAALVNPHATVIAIRGATILTAAGKVISGGTIVLSGGAITAIGADASVAIPAGARIVDGTIKFALPGRIKAVVTPPAAARAICGSWGQYAYSARACGVVGAVDSFPSSCARDEGAE